jgi:hypothetical protein
MARVVSKRKAQCQNSWKALGHWGGRFEQMNLESANPSTSTNIRHQPLDDELQQRGFKTVRNVVNIGRSDYQDMATTDIEGNCPSNFNESAYIA